jgi:hypothetical protein
MNKENKAEVSDTTMLGKALLLAIKNKFLMLVIAVLFVRMTINPARFIIDDMCRDDTDNGRNEQPVFEFYYEQFQNEKNKTGDENLHG